MYDLLRQRIEDRGQRTGNKSHTSHLTPHNPHLTPHTSNLKPHRRAVTLIELLVVVSIMMMLAAFALPKLGPMAKERKIREAARSVNVFLNRARSRAIETGRPCGVVFHRVVNDNNKDPLSKAVSMLYQAETPPPYAGDTTDAKVTMTITGGIIQANVTSAGSIQPNLLRIGDIMQINGQGPWYTLDSRNPDLLNLKGEPKPDGIIDGAINVLYLTVDRKYQNSLPWTATPSAPVSFKILRRPVRTIAQPLTLPVGTTIDLSASGTNQEARRFYTGKSDVTIMFSPNGSVGRYYWDEEDDTISGVFIPYEADATEPIYLLIGWREHIGGSELIPDLSTVETPDEEELHNWQMLSNLWVTLIPQSGLVSVSEMSHSDQAYLDVKNPPLKRLSDEIRTSYLINASRQYARQAYMKGGR